MKKSIYYIPMLIILGYLMPSCETEVDLGSIDIEPRLVFNAILAPNRDTSRIYITESRSIFSPSNNSSWGNQPFKPIKDAKVTIYINNIKHILQYSPKDSAYLYLKPLVISDNVNVKVEHADREIEASVIIPGLPEILSVDTITFSTVKNGGLIHYLRFLVKIKDPAFIKNYYRIKVDFAEHYQSPIWNEFEYWKRSSQFISDDPVLNNGNPSSNNSEDDDVGLVTYPPNFFGVFQDSAFDGKEYILNFYVNNPSFLSNKEEYDRGHLTITIQTITEDLYKYYFSLQRYLHKGNNGLIEPVVVFSNINNGLGILGAYNEEPIINILKH